MDREVTNEQVEHPRCAILPSPEKLNVSINSLGQDLTNTQGDFNNVWQWARQKEFLNTTIFVDAVTVDEGKQLEALVYESLIKFAFSSAVDPIRNTFSPENDELVLLYYTGHGLDVQSANGRSSSPLLDNDYFKIAENGRTSDRTVKGGELCLHDFGYCDLMGLLTPWIKAVNEESRNAPGVKKNKHLVVIADSCYSGVLVQDLKKLPIEESPWKEFKENGCTVTVQSACGSDEPTFGGYFTPCFVYFNKPENQPFLRKLKNEWDGKSEEEKNAYRAVDLPSERLVATTMPSERLISKDPILLLPVIQGLTLTLFPDAGFFKFCFLSFSGIVGSKVRALTPPAIDTFLSQVHFTILDYKLKIIANGTPMALVLVDDPNDTTHVVCVHIHFYNATTDLGNVSRVNLVHRKRPTNPDYLGHLLWREDTPDDLDCLSHLLWWEDTPDDAPDDAPNDAPNDAPDDAPNDAPNDAPDDAPNDTPNDTPNDAPNDAPNDTPNDTPDDPPNDTLNDAPNNTPNDAPNNTLNDAPNNTPNDAPNNTLNDAPNNTPNDAPNNTLNDAPNNTPNDAPNNTLNDAPNNTPNDAPNNTPNDAPNNTPNDAPNNTPNDTPDDTPNDISHGKWKFEPPFTTELVELVKQCKDYVEKNDPSGIWADSTRWNMEQSFNNLFRLKERSTWMEDYVKKTTEKNSQAPTLYGHYIFVVCIIIISMVLAYAGYY